MIARASCSQGMLRMLPVLVVAILGCAASQPSTPVPEVAPGTQAEHHRSPLTINEINAGLKDLPVWPYAQRDFSPREWLQIVEFASRLQGTDADTVLGVLRNYVHVGENQDAGKHVGEWSKVYILLRVLFDVPSERYDEHKHSLPPISGGGFMPAYRSRRECERLDSVLSRPILWTKQGPRLFSSLVGYNGKPYNVDYEWSGYRTHYKHRNLDETLKVLRAKVVAESQPTRPAGPQSKPALLSR
jgi:hypothetical protein